MRDNGRNAELDGLRGFAAVCVVFYHSILGLDYSLFGRVFHGDWSRLSGYDLSAKVVLTICNGQAAVILFFVISGTVLSRGLMKEQGPPLMVSLKFLIRRFFRIYPALFVGVLLCAGTFRLFGMNFGWEDVAANLVLYRFPINGATWTLQVELIASLLLAICFGGSLLFEKPLFGRPLFRRPWSALIVAVGLILLFDRHVLGPADDNSFRVFWICFALGMAIPTPAGRWVADRSPNWTWLAALILVLATRTTLQYISASVLVNLLYHARGGAFAALLKRPLSQFLGRISYSFYLLNVLFLEIICASLRSEPWIVAHPVEMGVCVAIVIVFLTIPLAYLSWAWVETPMDKLGHRLSGRSHPRPALTSTPASA